MRNGVEGSLGVGLALCLSLNCVVACSSAPSARSGPDGGGSGGEGGVDASAPESPESPDSRTDGTGPTPGLDPGRVAIHRLNNLEYDNTIRDLLGVEAQARATFQPDEEGEFDNAAEAFTMNDARYEQYFDSADTVTEAAFADPTLHARIVTCAPATPTDTACAARIVAAFGRRAWRRPLTDDEVARFVAFSSSALTTGKDFDTAMKTVVKAMLSSAPFLYRIEADAVPTSLTPHAVAPYELASRLSYWLWSTMPDEHLFALADSGALAQPSTLVAEVERLLADQRSSAFVESFAGQWLGIRDLQAHQVEPTTFPTWDEPLRGAMAQEMSLYFSEFLRGDRPFDQFLDADVNFVDAELARIYGMDATGLGAALVRVENKSDARKGFLGLGGWLTETSFSSRTAPDTRSQRVVYGLLCETVPFPPEPHVPQLDGSTPVPQTFRQEAAMIAATSACAACHQTFDPIAVGLEEFDAIGRYRTKDENGNAIDPSGVLADGQAFSGEVQLSDLLAQDPRFLACAGHKSLTYALGRMLTDADEPHLANLGAAWRRQGLTLRGLLELIVLDDTFRFRRGEANP